MTGRAVAAREVVAAGQPGPHVPVRLAVVGVGLSPVDRQAGWSATSTPAAASSASQDYTIMSLLLFPIWSIVDGRRRGIKHPWLFCGFILFASSAFAWAAYLASRLRRITTRS